MGARMAICCMNLKRQVNAKVLTVESERGNGEEMRHWTVDCPCGDRHQVFDRWGYAEVAIEVAKSAENLA